MPIVAPTAAPSPVGTVYVADTPSGFALFYTGSEFDGRLNESTRDSLREFFAERFSTKASLTTCHQVHGTRVASFRASDAGWCEEASCDALRSDTRASAVAIKVADCLPVTLIDPGASTVANIHAGWRGSAARIIDATISEVQQHTNFAPGRAHAFLGPSIRSCCFEVGEEVIAAFAAAFDFDVEQLVDRGRGERPYLDLVGLNTRALVDRGIAEGAVIDSGLCTRCDERFHSYRRNGADAGRNLAIALH